MRLALIALLVTATPLAAQQDRVGMIDFYGTHRLPAQTLSEAVGVQPGDSLTAAQAAEIRARLLALPGVTAADVSVICCVDGVSVLYVGVLEELDSALVFRAAPTGDIRLPNNMVAAGDEFMRALIEGVRSGQAGEDVSEGHSLMHYEPARAVQQRFVTFANSQLPMLRDVLQNSSSAEHRALAATIIAYVTAKTPIIPDLVAALRDPHESVRNNAARALGVLARHAQNNPTQGLRVPITPFLAMLNSPAWTDRNKASFVLLALTEGRDHSLLTQLRAQALEPLVQMARWQAPGHAMPAALILGRMAGLSDEEAMHLFETDRDALIQAARTVQ